MGRMLFVEDLRQKISVVEQVSDGLPTRIKAIVQQADQINRNHRIYPKAILQREIEKFNQDPARRPGLVDHPIDLVPSVEDIGIRWEAVSMDENGAVWGEGLLVETRKGNDLRAAIKAGVEIGISSRGYASAKRVVIGGEEVWVIGDDYELETFDAVVDPGVAEARIKHAEQLERGKSMEEPITEAEVEQAEAQAEAAAEVESVVAEDVVEDEVEETVAEEAAVETDDVVVEESADEPVVEESADETVSELDALRARVAELEQAAEVDAAAAQRVAELEARVTEAEAEAATLRQHASNLRAAMDALKQAAKDALDRESFYATSYFADVAGFIKYLASDLEYEAEFSEEETEALEGVVAAFRGVFAAVEKGRAVEALAKQCQTETYGLLIFRRLVDAVEKAEGLTEAVATERVRVEATLAARKGQAVAPRGQATEAKAEPVDPAKVEGLAILKELQSR